MPLKKLAFRTDVFTGTRKREGVGESLAKLLIGSATLATQVAKVKQREEKKETAEEERDSHLVRLTQQNEFKKDWNSAISNGELSTAEQQEKFINDSDVSDIVFADNSINKEKYRAFLNSYGSIATNTKIKENKNTARDTITTGMANLNISDFQNMEDIDKVYNSLKFLDVDLKKDFVIGSILHNSTSNLERDYATIDKDGSSALHGLTKDELLTRYGGFAFSQIENKNTKEYKTFEASLDKISGKLITQKTEADVKNAIENEVDATNVIISANLAGLDEKKTLKFANNTVNKALAIGDTNKAIRIANQYRANGIVVHAIDNKVGNMFLTGVPDSQAIKLYNMTKDDYPYDSKVVSDMNLLNATSTIYGYDMATPDGLKTTMDRMVHSKKQPIDKKAKQDIHDDIVSTTLGFGRSGSEQAFMIERAYDYHRVGLSKDDAVEFAEDEYDKYDIRVVGEKPYGMWAKDDKDISLFIKSRSVSNSEDDVEMIYNGNEMWIINSKNQQTISMSNKDIKAEVARQTKIESTIDKFSIALSESKPAGDDKELKKIIRKRAETEVIRTYPDIAKNPKEKKRLMNLMILDGIEAIKEARDKERSDMFLKFSDLF